MVGLLQARIGRARARVHAAAVMLLLAGPLVLQPSVLLAAAGDTDAISPVELPSWAPSPLPGEVQLGEQLFGDQRLSKDDKLACSSCHDLASAGADGNSLSEGMDSKPLRRNVPTVFNAALSATLGWTGAFADLESQAFASIVAPKIMAADWPEVISKLESDDGYRQSFINVYGSGPTPSNITTALAAFERTLLTPGSRFDRYLQGETTVLTSSEVAGYRLFQDIGCVSCHQGRNIGGNLFQRFGLFSTPQWAKSGVGGDLGRLELTGNTSDQHVYRVPSLRNVSVTPPYFHNGSAKTLTDAVTVMARTQLGRSLDREDVDRIVQFLGTLTGNYEGRPLSTSEPPPQ